MASREREPFLNLRLLRYWVLVVEEGSFTAAAKRLSITQPSLSQQIRSLEHWFGGPLLTRAPSGTVLTPAGRALLPEAHAILASAARARRTTREALGLEAGTLEIASYSSLAAGRLLPAIRRWHEVHAGMTIRVREFIHRTLADSVARGVADLGIGAPPTRWTGPLEHLGYEELVVVLPPNDPLLADGGPVALEALSAREWVLYERGVGLADLVSSACAHVGFQPRIAVETSHVEAAARLAAAGLGPALVPAKNAPPEASPTVRRVTPTPVWEVAAFAPAAWSSAASAFLAILREQEWEQPPAGAFVVTLR
jgi:DNA-binding transcriptional LysR family regulator